MLVWVIIGIIVTLVVLPLLIGLMLPQQTRATRVDLVRAPIDQVWESLADLARHTEWRSDLKSVQLKDDDDGLRWLEHSKTYGKLVVRKVKEVHHKEIMMSFQRGKGFKGTREARLNAVPGGTRVTFTETRDIRNPITRLRNLFGSKLDIQLNQYISELKTKYATKSIPPANTPTS
ncbi:SRPBCC family protein [Thiofilum flexile]|uniref:SRPBCC family protein n=1 Tax=Thiofilum flexile TaxID=125627 RepID=UPI000363C8AE|nr:SRPBCC family protein [Thiofilum flexile]